jgi:UDP-N-acetyl-D-galactosamine dehydrogenase
MNLDQKTIAVIGLGYVGLPLAVEFAKKRAVIGFDIQGKRIEELTSGYDRTLELSKEELKEAAHLSFTANPDDLQKAQIFIVTVPTPINSSNQPDITLLLKASETVARALKKGDVVIYESTVYPGCTEEDCVPILEKVSGLKFNIDFFVGYSPERINPGDKKNTITKIKKITSGSTAEIANLIDGLYSSIITAGTHKASSIMVAEAAKIIENIQRDVNIALINEFALIFHKLNIDTMEVLEAAGTKWNFLPFKPGLVGGHCIGIDPYYLAYKALQVNYHPDVILAGRRVNNNIAKHICDETIRKMVLKGVGIRLSNILILGLTFKENCSDIRNSKVFDMVDYLEGYQINVDVFDPLVDLDDDLLKSKKIKIIKKIPKKKSYQAIILAVGHNQFIRMGIDEIKKISTNEVVFVDVKAIFDIKNSDFRL